MVDRKFFSYVGLEKESHKKIIDDIKEKCGSDSYKNRDEIFIARKIADDVFGAYIFEYAEYFRTVIIRAETDVTPMEQKPVDDWRFMKEKLQYMGMVLESYDEDLDIAIYMLTGSYLSKWVGVRLVMEPLPFSVVENKMSSWCRLYQDMMLKGNRFQIMDLDEDSLKGHQRLEKYSYRRVCKMHGEMREAIYKEQNGIIDGKKNKSPQENVQGTGQEYVENYILEDMMMGISFTTILYHYIKRVRETEFYRVEPIIALLAQIKAIIMRNKITDIVFSYMEQNKYRAEMVEAVIDFLQSYVKKINTVYMSLMSLEWRWLAQDALKKGTRKDIWEKYIVNDFFDVGRVINYNMSDENEYILKNYFDNRGFISTPYDNELQRDIEAELGMVQASKIYQKSENVYRPTYKGVLAIMKVCKLNNRGMLLEDIENENRSKWNEKEEIRNDKFSTKSKQVLYTRIHKTVILGLKKKNSGKFPIG